MVINAETNTLLKKKMEEHLGEDIRQFAILEALMFKGNISRNQMFLHAALMTLLQAGKISLVKRD